jgi:hypothetical protein
MMISTAAYALGRRIGGFLLGGVILWQVAERAGPSQGRAIVHIAVAHVDLIVDQDIYRVDDLSQTPIVCELRPGRHTARLSRDGEVFYQEEFLVAAGQESIVSTWDPVESARRERVRVLSGAPGLPRRSPGAPREPVSRTGHHR